MKLFNIKSITAIAAIALTLNTTSCVGDLDVDPINPQQTMELDADALFGKIYASFALTGQNGPSGNPDIADMDEGRSDFFRMMWNLNELTTDEAHWVWTTDTGIPEMLHNTYGASAAFSNGLYYRLYFTITLCNFYLDQVAEDGTTETSLRRAEVRFIRALNYYYIMDMYGNAAFTETVSTESPIRYTRSEYFNYIEKELKECADLMAEPGQNTYGRVDKVAAWNLLSRLYLNAEVYTGTPQWQNAQSYAEKVINNGYYKLNTTGATNPKTGEKYSAYQMLFLADNNENGAEKEIIFPALFDGVATKSYGGMNFLILSTFSAAMDAEIPSGTNCSWGKCTRVRGSLLNIFFSSDAPQTNSIAEMTAAANDDRALFYGKGFSHVIEDEADADAGFACVKFRNIRSDGASNQVIDFVNTDLPFMRVAEAYLTYAEASTRQNGANSAAKEKIDALRNRANAPVQSQYTLDDICDEWAREFWFEGRRRIDLVRHGKFAGQANYKWEWMGGTMEGSQFSSTKSIFGIPENDLSNNPNLIQNEGY
ncbi:MAG: RagB/SusD family nutrient uptake outer membrane protein [Mediterranea massiliensis]|nr:RagB/SusD family nutrient uptake outer membrane protein [Mediterranea massiliensis]